MQALWVPFLQFPLNCDINWFRSFVGRFRWFYFANLRFVFLINDSYLLSVWCVNCNLNVPYCTYCWHFCIIWCFDFALQYDRYIWLMVVECFYNLDSLHNRLHLLLYTIPIHYLAFLYTSYQDESRKTSRQSSWVLHQFFFFFFFGMRV